MKAVLHYRASPAFRRAVARMEGVEVAVVDETDDEAFFREIADAEVLLHALKPVTSAMMDAAPAISAALPCAPDMPPRPAETNSRPARF